MHRPNCIYKKGKEHKVAIRCLARAKQVFTIVGTHRPVVVLARTINTSKRLFVQNGLKVVAQGNFFHQVHKQQVMVYCYVYFFKNRSYLVLVRSYLVMPCF